MQPQDLIATMDRLVMSDPSTYGDAESIEALYRQLARFEAFVTAATGTFEASGAFAPDGARNAASWLAARCRVPKNHARARVRRARAMRHLPASAGAWLEGDIGAPQVDVIAGLRRDATEEALQRDEQTLVDEARKLRYESFVRVAAYWEQLADPNGVEDDEERRRERRQVYLESSFQGMWLGKITLDPISGSIVAAELDRLESEMFEADWAEARLALGREPNLLDMSRTPGQRRADALVEMATRSRTAPKDGRRPAPLFTVLVGYEALHGRICELARGTVIAPGALVPWLEEAAIERAVFGPERRVEISARARLFTGATRRAIELRDRECTHPYCDVPVDHCQVDHIVPYPAGGPTTQENGRLLCGFHNRLRNHHPPDRE